MKYRKPPYWLVFTLVATLSLSAFGDEAEAQGTDSTNKKPNITITHAPDDLKPGSDSTGKIAGKVSDVNIETCKVVLFAKAEIWYVQPLATTPDTNIDEEGKWESKTHGGFQYAALLVKASYNPLATMKKLPKVAGDVLAIDIVPSITITHAPDIPPGPNSMGPIEGKVRAVNIEACQVVIFAWGDRWYVQPFTAAPYTDINEDGTWENQTHGGFQYAALLVTAAYKPPNTTVILPRVDGKKILAIGKAKPKKR